MLNEDQIIELLATDPLMRVDIAMHNTATAQVHATLRQAHQLERIADVLESTIDY